MDWTFFDGAILLTWKKKRRPTKSVDGALRCVAQIGGAVVDRHPATAGRDVATDVFADVVADRHEAVAARDGDPRQQGIAPRTGACPDVSVVEVVHGEHAMPHRRRRPCDVVLERVVPENAAVEAPGHEALARPIGDVVDLRAEGTVQMLGHVKAESQLVLPERRGPLRQALAQPVRELAEPCLEAGQVAEADADDRGGHDRHVPSARIDRLVRTKVGVVGKPLRQARCARSAMWSAGRSTATSAPIASASARGIAHRHDPGAADRRDSSPRSPRCACRPVAARAPPPRRTRDKSPLRATAGRTRPPGAAPRSSRPDRDPTERAARSATPSRIASRFSHRTYESSRISPIS